MKYIEKKRTKIFGLPWTFTKYIIDDEKVTIKSGFLSTVEDDAYMYKIQDVRLVRSFFERLARIGTVICYTGDTTHPELKLVHIRRANEIKDFLMFVTYNIYAIIVLLAKLPFTTSTSLPLSISPMPVIIPEAQNV